MSTTANPVSEQLEVAQPRQWNDENGPLTREQYTIRFFNLVEHNIRNREGLLVQGEYPEMAARLAWLLEHERLASDNDSALRMVSHWFDDPWFYRDAA